MVEMRLIRQWDGSYALGLPTPMGFIFVRFPAREILESFANGILEYCSQFEDLPIPDVWLKAFDEDNTGEQSQKE